MNQTQETSTIDDLDEAVKINMLEKNTIYLDDYFGIANTEEGIYNTETLKLDLQSYSFTYNAFEIIEQRSEYYYQMLFKTEQDARKVIRKLKRNDLHVYHATYSLEVITARGYDPKSKNVIDCYISTYMLKQELSDAGS